jgi:sulfur relay (sulfurtransferase) DsrF/TusC family protein
LERVAQVANETGCTFVFVHHDRKGEGETDEQRVLGTTALTAAADVVLQLQPVGDDAGVTTLKAMGNAIDEQALYFTVQHDFWLAPTERPAVTKEEKSANAIAGYLRLHGEAKRKELERHLQEIGLAESHSAAEKLFDRAVVVLQGKVVRTQRGIYILQSDLKHSDDTKENVFVVGNSKPNSDNSANPDIPDMSEL